MTDPQEDFPWRAIDASVNRAAEGFRVVEDFTRFVLDDPHLTHLAKELRHDLQASVSVLPPRLLAAMRDTPGDVGATISTAREYQRKSPRDVCAASLKRAEQSLRSIEEFGKLVRPGFACLIERLRYRCYSLEKAIAHTADALERLTAKRLYVLIDGRESDSAFANQVQQLSRAGVDMLQLRDKKLSDRELVQRARTLVRIARPLGVLAIVNNRPDIAAAVHADGVHLGQDDCSVGDARRIVGPEAVIGVSTHGIDQARQAVLAGADYLGAGPTFPSRTKAFDDFAGLDYLREVAAEVRLPTFAIGGINATNLPEVLATGVSRIAVSAAIADADDVEQAIRQFQLGFAASRP